jgi:hypothetical protein
VPVRKKNPLSQPCPAPAAVDFTWQGSSSRDLEVSSREISVLSVQPHWSWNGLRCMRLSNMAFSHSTSDVSLQRRLGASLAAGTRAWPWQLGWGHSTREEKQNENTPMDPLLGTAIRQIRPLRPENTMVPPSPVAQLNQNASPFGCHHGPVGEKATAQLSTEHSRGVGSHSEEPNRSQRGRMTTQKM